MSFPSQGYTPTTFTLPRLLATLTNVARTANQEWFASDFVPQVGDNLGSDIILIFAFDTRTIIEVTLDSGVTFFALNNNQKVEKDTLNSFAIPVLNTDLVNFRASSAGTIRTARVLENV